MGQVVLKELVDMTKVTKLALKRIVKECLIEILTEGLAESSNQLRKDVKDHGISDQKKNVARRSVSLISARPRSASLDHHVTSNPNLKSSAQSAAQMLTDDPVLQDVLIDTACGSLQEAVQNDPDLGRPDGRESRPIPATAGPTMSGDPDKIFDQIVPGVSKKWAQLAFAPPKTAPPTQLISD